MGRREELARDEAVVWEELTACLARLSPDGFDRPVLNADGWSAKDLMWHVAFWCADAARALAEIGAGTFDRASEREDPREIDSRNDAQLARSRAMERAEVEAELHRARASMLERFGALHVLTAEADEWFEESGPIHYAKHLPELRSFARASGF